MDVLLELLPVLLLALGLGRVILSFFPPGPLGSHALGELPRTLAASLLLGLLAMQLHARLLDREPISLALATTLLVFVRLSTLPGAMIPPRSDQSLAPKLGARLLLLGACALPWLVEHPNLSSNLRCLGALAQSALVLVLDQALTVAKSEASALRSPTLRRALLCLWMLAFAWICTGLDTWAALAACAAVAWAVPWLRIADRRAGALSACACAFAGHWASWNSTAFALLLICALVLLTQAPARRWILLWCGLAMSLRLLLDVLLQAQYGAWQPNLLVFAPAAGLALALRLMRSLPASAAP